MSAVHLEEELRANPARVSVDTAFGPITGGRASNGAAVFLEIPYAVPPGRFQDPQPLPSNFRYENIQYIKEKSYAVQPGNDGQAQGIPTQDKLGLGKPTENPLFVNVVSPPSFPAKSSFPVKIYIHGGYLQYGSPHGLSAQAQFVSAARGEVWVNIGYRLSAFGFLASDKPQLDGNYGFKDQWLALQWIKSNISAFGGDPENIQVTGLSAGAHSVHQLLHRASHLPAGETAPFNSAVLQSNSIVASSKTKEELRPQFEALCLALGLDPGAPDILDVLRDPSKVSADSIARAIDSGALGTQYLFFRGCSSTDWLPEVPDLMTWQRSGDFAEALRQKGVRSIVVGHLTEEWYVYSLTGKPRTMDELRLGLMTCFSERLVDALIPQYRSLPDNASADEVQKLFGEILSDGQVHLPVRILIRDLYNAGFPALRYKIAWTPEQFRPEGYVTHGTDRPLWIHRIPSMTTEQIKISTAWLDSIDAEVEKLERSDRSERGMREVLKLNEDKTIGWREDPDWDMVMRLTKVLPNEQA